MKLLFVGTKMQGYFIEEVSNANNWHLDYVETPENVEIENLLSQVVTKAVNVYDYIIYDVTSCLSEAEKIAEIVDRIRSVNGIKPILIVNSVNANNVVVRACLDRKISNFINRGAGTISDLKEELIFNVTELYDKSGREEVEEIQRELEKERINANQIRTIGVAGVCRRIGTTTQAVQITKYLATKGYEACLVEMNEIKYPNIRQSYNGKSANLSYIEMCYLGFKAERSDEEKGYVRIDGVDLFYKAERLHEILKLGYDFYVYDYGAYNEKYFNKTAFDKDEVQILVCGSDPCELDCLIPIVDNAGYNSAKLIFSFTDDENAKDICRLFEGLSSRCFFTGDVRDPFSFSEDTKTFYDSLFDIEENETNLPKKEKKKKLFGRIIK